MDAVIFAPHTYREDTEHERRLNRSRHGIIICPVFLAIFAIGIYLPWSLTNEKQTKTYMDEQESGINSLLPRDKQQASWMKSLLPLGAVIGSSLPVGILADKYGRKFVSWFSTLPLLIGWLIILFVKLRITMYIARFFVGVGCGAASIVLPIYFYEIGDKIAKQYIESTICMCFHSGILLQNLQSESNDQMMLPVFIFVSTIGMLMIPESPKWLEARGRREEAERAIKILTRLEVKLDATKPVESIDNSGLRPKVFEFISNKKDVFIILGLIIFQQFSGISVLTVYQDEYVNCILNSSDGHIILMLVLFAPVIAVWLTPMIVKNFGEKCVILTTTILVAIFSFSLAAYNFYLGEPKYFRDYSSLLSILLGAYLSVFHLGLGMVPWIMIGKMFSNSTRKVVYNLAAICAWACMFIVIKTFYDLVDNMGICILLIVYGFINVIGAIFILIAVPRTIQEVQDTGANGSNEININLEPTQM